MKSYTKDVSSIKSKAKVPKPMRKAIAHATYPLLDSINLLQLLEINEHITLSLDLTEWSENRGRIPKSKGMKQSTTVTVQNLKIP